MESTPPAVRGRTRVLRASLDASVAEGAVAEVFGACAGGAVLTGWALYFGATPIVIGVLGALPFAAQIVQVPAAWLTQRVGAKPLALVAVGAARLAWLPLIAVPFLAMPQPTALAIFATVVAVAALFGVVGNNAWTAWMGDLIPPQIRGRFFARRMIFVNAAGTVSSLAAGVALDASTPRGFRGETLAALAAVACVAGLVSVRLLLAQHTVPPARDAGAPDWRDALRAARDRRTRPLLAYLLAWSAAVGIAAAFFAFHMLTNLHMAFTFVAAYTIIVAALRIVSAPAWGRLVDTCGARPVLVVCSLGISAVPLLWLFVTPDRWWPIAIEAVISGTLWGGHGIAAFDVMIGVSPRRARPFYLAVFSAGAGVGFAVSSVLAGLLATVLSAPLRDAGSAWSEIHVLFLLSTLGRAGAAFLAVRIAEPAARGVPDLARALLGAPARRTAKPSPASLSP
jgi:MFS family permease